MNKFLSLFITSAFLASGVAIAQDATQNNKELTFSMIKPDAAKSEQVVKDIQSIVKENGLEIKKAKKIKLSDKFFNQLYGIHKDKAFFQDLKNSILDREVVVQVLEGNNAVEKYRETMGSTNPQKAADGTIRKKYGTDVTRNAVHGADSKENALREICIFFQKEFKIECSKLLSKESIKEAINNAQEMTNEANKE
ncbi:MAG: Nucleoside diphosphate kinase [Pseudomonadota bacterium]|jgi:nucleoside-diphosphate kinase